jgi:branched-chain amino acid transport system permease protein
MLQYIAEGIIFGSIIALGAIGLSLVYNIMRFPNFAHGEFISIGAYWGVFIAGLIVGLGAPIAPFSFGWTMLPALLLAMAASIVIALAVDRVLYRPIDGRGGDRKSLIIAAFAASIMLRNAIVLIYGPGDHYFSLSIQRARTILPGVRATPDEVFVVGVAVAAVVALHLFLTYTSRGKQLRATAENPTLASINGIDVPAVYRLTWVLSTALAALAGVSFGIIQQIRPEMGFDLLLPMFAALILGGVTSIYGAIFAGIIVGVAESLSVMLWAAEYKQAVSFAVVVLILMVRPHGLFGEKA